MAAAGRVVSVELDRKLFALLQAKFVAAANLELVNADILRCSLGDLAHGVDYKIIANIPYNITSRFIKNLLTAAAKPSIAVLLVQKEVAQRVCAKPGDLSLLGLSSQLYSRPEIIATVGRDQFWPAPAVDSAILVLRDIKPAAAVGDELKPLSEKQFWQVARIGFSARRKKLTNNLAAGLKITSQAAQMTLVEAGLAPNIRAQDLSVSDWQQLAKKLKMLLN